MQHHLKNFESWLVTQYKKAPDLPKGFKDFLVDIAPWLSLLGGILSTWAAWNLWEWARRFDQATDYINELGQAVGVSTPNNNWTIGIWLSIVVMLATAILYLLAFSNLKERKKDGWNLLFYAALLNAAYGIVVAFTDYGTFGSLLGSLLGTVIGLYFLFEIRDHYLGAKPAAKKSAKS